MQRKGGYESLIVYWLAMTIYDLNFIFCNRYIHRSSRTHDQMVQAARSGKQNIVEGSLEKSTESNIKLTSIARASFGELLEDYKDFIRIKVLSLWVKEDHKSLLIRKTKDLPYKTYMSYMTYMSYTNNAENFANLMIILCYKESFLLDRLLVAQEKVFIEQGGFRERLFKKRITYKNKSY